jgi:hypothetical protein
MHTKRNAQPSRLALATGAAAALVAGFVAAGPAGATGASVPHSPTSASVNADKLTITGTERGDTLALRLAAGDPNTLEIDFGDDGSAEQRFDRSTFTAIEVRLLGGNDRFRVDQVDGAFADEQLMVFAGSGNDTLDGGDGVETFYGGSGNDLVDGNRGNDTGILGTGRDTFRWDPGDGSDVVEGQSGTDTLDFNGADGAEIMSLAPNGHRSLFLRNVGNIRMDMNDVEQLDLAALGGVDTISVGDMRGTGFRQANVDLSATAGGGDGAADTVTLEGTDRRDHIDVEARRGVVEVDGLATTVDVPGSEPTDTLQVNAIGADDDVDVSGAALALINVDLGSGLR